MSPSVFLLVLVAAACHAGWNAVVKVDSDPFIAGGAVALSSAIVALCAIPFVGLPPLAALPWMAGSMFFHVGYIAGLTEAYRIGDMSQVYPIARGTAPLLTANLAALFFDERVSARGWAGIALLGFGVLLLSFRGGKGSPGDRRVVLLALFTACTIAGYSIVDGFGARTAKNAHAYVATMFVGDGAIMAAFVVLRRGRAALADQLAGRVRRMLRPALFGGALSVASYWIAIWAMTIAPIPLVAALRETSVLFAAAIAVIFLREPLRASRLVAALLIVIGLMLIRLH